MYFERRKRGASKHAYGQIAQWTEIDLESQRVAQLIIVTIDSVVFFALTMICLPVGCDTYVVVFLCPRAELSFVLSRRLFHFSVLLSRRRDAIAEVAGSR